MEVYNFNEKDKKVINPVKEKLSSDSVGMNLFKVYGLFALGLLVTGLMTLGFPSLLALFVGSDNLDVYIASIVVFGVIALIASIGQMFATFSQNAIFIGVLYFVYAICLGGVFSSLTLMFSLAELASTFLITGGLMLAMGIIGVVSKGKISIVVSLFSVAVLGLSIISLFNIFLFHSNTIAWIYTIAIFIFFLLYAGLDIYRVQKLAQNRVFTSSNALALYMAYALYTDFVIIFIYLIRIMMIFTANSSNR